jgi:hypothetical protein
VGVLEEIAHARHQRGRHLGRLERASASDASRAATQPATSSSTSARCARRAGVVVMRGSPRGRSLHRLQKPREHPVVRARDSDPAAVAREEVVVGHRALRARSDPLADVAGTAVHRDGVVEHAQDRLVKGQIDDLALAGALGVAKRDEAPTAPKTPAR